MRRAWSNFGRCGRARCIAVLVAVLGGIAATAQAVDVDDLALSNENDTSGWPGYGRTYSEQRFSPLEQINAANVGQLGVEWSLDLLEDVSLTATPLVADGVLYFTNSFGVVRAVNAATGQLLWRYDPRTQAPSSDVRRSRYAYGGRGLAMWKDKVYVALADGQLIALDRRSGRQLWNVATIDPDDTTNYITGAPKALHGKIIVGQGGNESTRARGYVAAYDADTGQRVWRFYVVPGDPAKGFESKAMAMAARTHKARDWWKRGGGGQPWNESFTYDPDFNAIYFGTGNGHPRNAELRGGGDHLFLSSIVAVDADTGEYRWHYQQTPGETWDYDAASPMVLADLDIKGRKIKALLQAPKNGFFYVIDRSNGKLVSAQPYSEVNWAKRIDLKTGRPVENPGARYYRGKDAVVTPSDWGAHDWAPISFNPRTGLVYIPTFHVQARFTTEGVDSAAWSHPDRYVGTGVDIIEIGSTRKDGVKGTLQAWDPIAQKRVWEVPQPVMWSPGTLTTAGNLVFQGRADGKFVAYDASRGQVLWQFDLGLGIAAPPISYRINGRQYVVLLVGWGGGFAISESLGWTHGLQMRRLVAFSLDGKAQLVPQPPPEQLVPLREPSFKVDEGLAQKGAELFGRCGSCHGYNAQPGALGPDLRASTVVLSADAFARAVVGTRWVRGVRSHSFDGISEDELLALRHYIRARADRALDSKSGQSP